MPTVTNHSEGLHEPFFQSNPFAWPDVKLWTVLVPPDLNARTLEEMVVARSLGACERCLRALPDEANGWSVRLRGPERDWLDAANAVRLCVECWTRLDGDPEYAHDLAWDLESGVEPEEAPILRKGKLLYLTPNGGIRTAENAFLLQALREWQHRRRA